MNHSPVHVVTRYSLLLLAAVVAGCSPTDKTPTGINSSFTHPTFLTLSANPLSPAPVNLGGAGDFVILSKSGISTVPQSAITGNIGVSPIARGGLTGSSEKMDLTKSFSTSTQVVGKLCAADYAAPTPAILGFGGARHAGGVHQCGWPRS